MSQWAFYPAFLGTLVSLLGWSYFARKEHDKKNPLTLSELAAKNQANQTYFRNIIWICGILFATTVYFFIIPRVYSGRLLTITWSLTFLSELLLGLLPAKEKTLFFHNVFSYLMAEGMLVMAFLLCFKLHGVYLQTESMLALLMSVLAALSILNKKNFLFYELPFIFLSHATILVAAVALR
jgi:hypothetical protein